MSASDAQQPGIVARSADADPVEALRDALGDILAGLAAAGCGPRHLTETIWETGGPKALHPFSPIDQPRPRAARITLAVGEDESDTFKAQSATLARRWQAPAPLICRGHHFSMLEGLTGGALLDLALRTAEGK